MGPFLIELFEVLLEGRQVKVPVGHGAKLGHSAGDLTYGADKVLGLELMAQVALVCVGLLRLAAGHRATSLHLAAIQELMGLGVVELQRLALGKIAALIEPRDKGVCHGRMDGLCRIQSRSAIKVERYLIGSQRVLLGLMVGAHIVCDGALIALSGQFAVALHDRGAIAVGAAHKDHVLRANAIAQEAGIEIRRHKHAADMAKVQPFVAIRHASGDHGAARKMRPRSK